MLAAWLPSAVALTMRQANCTPPKAGQQGVVLIAVLWIVMALSIIVTGSVRDEAKMLSMARQGAQASALGDAAIQLVLQQMAVDAKPVHRMTTVQVPYQGRQMDVQVMPLNGLVDLNSAKNPVACTLADSGRWFARKCRRAAGPGHCGLP